MSEFVTVLRGRIQDAQQALLAAREAGHPYEAQLHTGRLIDLIELADKHGVDPTEWVAPAILVELGESR